MEKRESMMSFLWVVSLMALPLSQVPNRILLASLIIWAVFSKRSEIFNSRRFRSFIVVALTLAALSLIANDQLSSEFVLFLSIPAQGIFLIACDPDRKAFKTGYHLACLVVLAVLLFLKIYSVIQMGIYNYFSQDQWWNLWHYKSFTQGLDLHPTYLSLFLLVGMVWVLFGRENLNTGQKTSNKRVALFICYLIGLWLISSKIGLVVNGLLLVLFLAVQVKKTSRKNAVVLGILMSLAIVLPLTSPSVRHRLTHEMNTAAQRLPTDVPSRLSERRALWRSSFVEMDRNPVAGTSFRGLDARDVIYPRAKFLYTPLERPLNAHNNFIETGLRYGIIFGILLFLSSIFGLYKAFRSRSVEMLGLLIILTLISMTESFLFREQGLSLTALALIFTYTDKNGSDL